jgi:hypothetical protein
MMGATMATILETHLAHAIAALDDLRVERDRVLAEACGPLGFCLPGTLALSPWQSVLEQIDRWAGDTFPRLEKKAIETNDADLAFRLHRATANMLAMLRGTSPVNETIANVRKLADDITREVKAVAGAGVSVALLVVGGLVLLQFFRR